MFEVNDIRKWHSHQTDKNMQIFYEPGFALEGYQFKKDTYLILTNLPKSQYKRIWKVRFKIFEEFSDNKILPILFLRGMETKEHRLYLQSGTSFKAGSVGVRVVDTIANKWGPICPGNDDCVLALHNTGPDKTIGGVSCCIFYEQEDQISPMNPDPLDNSIPMFL